MEKSIIIFVFICLFQVFTAQGQVNIPQISTSEVESSGTLQLNAEQLNISSITQLGNYNTAKLSQIEKIELISSPNSSNSFQYGDYNQVDLTQKGNQNILFSFQAGYLATSFSSENTENTLTGVLVPTMLKLNAGSTGLFSSGNNNTLVSTQDGISNKFLSIQQGSNNYIQADQIGNNNNLVVQQVGNNNRVEDFVQNNIKGESDNITQIGDNNTLNSIDKLNTLYGNNYIQNGTNLSITLNNSTLSATGGITVNQTGHDMSVVIDKSYFSFPLK